MIATIARWLGSLFGRAQAAPPLLVPAPPPPVPGVYAPAAPPPATPFPQPQETTMPDPIAWGARVSPAFRTRVREIATDLGCPVDALMACMAWESGETFRADVRNMAGSGATGLIQFMPATARGLGTTVEALAALSPERQLDWVARYFRPYKGKLTTLADLYMAILWPAAVGKPMDHVLWSKAGWPTTYRQNAGLDANRDGVITKAECAGKVYAKLEKGLLPANRG